MRPTSADRWLAIPAALALAGYLTYDFELHLPGFWTVGLGDWMDPYFINALLEHWYRAVAGLHDPSSPPMFYPVQGTLGYSHGLVLYAPCYIALRFLFPPFIAYNLTLVVVMAAGTVCLHVLFRRGGLPFVLAALLSGLFLSSANVVNGETGVWSQRASVFLIPPIALLFTQSIRLQGVPALATAGTAGFLALSLYTQDFYTAHLAVLLVAAGAIAALAIEAAAVKLSIARLWTSSSRSAKIALAVAMLALVWVAVLWATGGIDTRLLGIRIRSRGVVRPAIVAAAAILVWLWLHPIAWPERIAGVAKPTLFAFATGAAAASALFFWIYLPSYREHSSFPEQNLLSALVSPDPARWTSPTATLDDLTAYPSPRTFIAAILVTLLVWWPGANIDRRTRRYAASFLAISALVFVLPLRLGDLSPWRLLVAPLPGYSVIRDPKRVIFLYELAAVGAIGLIVSRLSDAPLPRRAATTMLTVLLLLTWNRERLERYRPVEVFGRLVLRPIAVDPACRSFFMTAASPAYASRSTDMFTLYGIDATFIALRLGIPTLNGYSAWTPPGWNLHNPHEPDYLDRVRGWIARNQLSGVCSLDVESGRMAAFR